MWGESGDLFLEEYFRNEEFPEGFEFKKFNFLNKNF